MTHVFRTSELYATGLSPKQLRKEVAANKWTRVCRGRYSQPDAERIAVHRALAVMVVQDAKPDLVISHVSAAVMHGLPVWRSDLEHVAVSRDGSAGGRLRHGLQSHATRLPAADVVEIDGVAVTSIARTIADLARSPHEWTAISAGDVGLSAGCTREEIVRVLDGMSRWPGAGKGRAIARWLDPMSESPGESVSRLMMHREGLPTPRLQQAIHDAQGHFLGRVDFLWSDQRVVGEFDGMVKYGELPSDSAAARDVLIKEKLREDSIRAAGYTVVRWGLADLQSSSRFASAISRALHR